MIRFQFVDDHRTEYSVKRMCDVLKLNRSGPTQHAGDVSLSVVPADGAVDEVPGDGGGGVLGGWCWWQCVGFELVVVPVA